MKTTSLNLTYHGKLWVAMNDKRIYLKHAGTQEFSHLDHIQPTSLFGTNEKIRCCHSLVDHATLVSITTLEEQSRGSDKTPLFSDGLGRCPTDHTCIRGWTRGYRKRLPLWQCSPVPKHGCSRVFLVQTCQKHFLCRGLPPWLGTQLGEAT